MSARPTRSLRPWPFLQGRFFGRQKKMASATRYIIWAHRDANSVFGPAANPVVRNGALLSFENRTGAHRECDRLNARRGNPHVRYAVKRVVRDRRLALAHS